MTALRLFMDTHDTRSGTFPEGLTHEQFATFYETYAEACRAEGVVIVRTHVGFGEGRAFCLNLAPDAEAVRRAHQRAGLPFDGIVEVETASPADAFLRLRAEAA